MSAFSYQYTNEYLAGNTEVAVLERAILAVEQANELRVAEIVASLLEEEEARNRLAELDSDAPLLYAMERYCKKLSEFIATRAVRRLYRAFALGEANISAKALQALEIRSQLIDAFILDLIEQLITLNTLAASFEQKDPPEPVPQSVLDDIIAQQEKITIAQTEQSHIAADTATHTALFPVRFAAFEAAAAQVETARALYKNFAFDDRARRGIGIVQPQSGLDYPLVYPSEDIKYLIANFYLGYTDVSDYDATVPPAQHPLRIKHLYGFGCQSNQPAADFPQPVNQADIVVVDANNRVILDTSADESTSCHVIDSDPVYTTVNWQTKNAVCSLIAYKKWPDDDNGTTDDDTERSYDLYLTPARAILDARAVYKIPKRLMTLRVRNGPTLSEQFRGDIVFRNSYNTEIVAGAPATTNFKVTTPVTFSAVPGSGEGKYPCDADFNVNDLRVITQINGLSGNSGDFTLSGKDCLWLRRPTIYANDTATASPTANLQIGADCKPCCACEDYASTALYMNSVRDRYKLIGTRAEAVRSRHEENIARWNEYRICSVQSPLRLIFVPQRCPYIDVVLLLCNPCQSCLPTSTLTLTLTAEGDAVTSAEEPVTAEIACGYTAMYATGINGAATSIDTTGTMTYAVTFPQLQPGDSAYVKFRLKFSLKAPYLIRGALTGVLTVSEQPITIDCDGVSTEPAQAEAAQTIYCDETGNTEMPC